MFVIAALAAFKGLSKIHTRSPCGDWMPVERPKCSPSCTWTPIGSAMLSSENQGFCRSGTNQKASSEGQVEPKWRLEASLESHVEPKWRLEASLEVQVESKWFLEASLEGQVALVCH